MHAADLKLTHPKAMMGTGLGVGNSGRVRGGAKTFNGKS